MLRATTRPDLAISSAIESAQVACENVHDRARADRSPRRPFASPLSSEHGRLTLGRGWPTVGLLPHSLMAPSPSVLFSLPVCFHGWSADRGSCISGSIVASSGGGFAAGWESVNRPSSKPSVLLPQRLVRNSHFIRSDSHLACCAGSRRPQSTPCAHNAHLSSCNTQHTAGIQHTPCAHNTRLSCNAHLSYHTQLAHNTHLAHNAHLSYHTYSCHTALLAALLQARQRRISSAVFIGSAHQALRGSQHTTARRANNRVNNGHCCI